MKEPTTTKHVTLMTIGITLGSVVLLIGLGLGGLTLFAWMLSDPVPEEGPQYPVVFGVRADGDHLLVSTGRECPARTKFDIQAPRIAEPSVIRFLNLTALTPVTFIDLTDPGPQFRRDSISDVPGWEVHTVEITTDLPRGPDPFFSRLEITNLKEESFNHPEQYYFGEMGWLTPDDVAARDGIDLLTICTPRPS